jgi:hypothetical protein
MSTTVEWVSSKYTSGALSFKSFRTLLLIITGLGATLCLAEALRFLPVTGENVYPESAGVLAAQRWASGLPLYGDYRQPPYLMTAFPPLWYAFLALAAKAGATNLDSLTLLGRLWSLASVFGLAAVGYLWNRRLGLSSQLAVLTPTFYFSFPIFVPWAVTARPDFPALFLGLLALYWASFRSSTSSVCLAGFGAALAFLTKHNTVAVPVALVLWLLWSKRWKHAGLFCAFWGLVVGLTLSVFQLSGQGLLLLNLSGSKFGQFAFTYVRDVLNRLLVTAGNGFAIALFAFGVFGFLQSWNDPERHTRLLNIYLVVSLSFAVLGSAAAGAAVNYYFEPALAMAMLVPTGLARLEQQRKEDSPVLLLVTVMVLALLVPSLDVQRWNLMHEKPEDLRSIVPLVESRRVFTDIPFLAARASTPQLVDLASLINTERAGGWGSWSSVKVVGGLQEKRYELVILSQPVDMLYVPAGRYPRWPRVDSAIRLAVSQNYGLCFESHASYVYGPLSANPNSPQPTCPSQEEISRLGGLVQRTTGPEFLAIPH